MITAMADDSEFSEQIWLLRAPPAEQGSGFVRYAAAMHFYRCGMMDPEALEIYRALAKDDAVDALSIALARGCMISPAIAAALKGGEAP